MEIDAALDRLERRIRREGLVVPPPVPTDELTRAEAELAPLRLPAEYRRFAARMSPAVPLVGFPQLHTIAFALTSWRQEHDIGQPRVLLTIGYTSHNWLAVELASDAAPGGELWFWGVGEDFRHVDGRLPGVVAALADAPIERHTGYGHVWVAFDVRTLCGGPSVGWDVAGWPEHWRRAQGYGAGDPTPAGATTTVAALLAARAHGPVRERLHVWVTAVTGMARASFVTVEDVTGAMVVRWPTAAGPARPEVFTDVELEVTCDPSMHVDAAMRAEAEQAHRDATRAAREGDEGRARKEARRLHEALERHGADAEVRSARRLSR